MGGAGPETVAEAVAGAETVAGAGAGTVVGAGAGPEPGAVWCCLKCAFLS